MSLPLKGIKILDLSQAWAVPGAVMYLADQGAEVIKVEPFEGDSCRSIMLAPPVDGSSRAFLVLNRNKRGIAVDITTPEGRDIIYKIVKTVDIIALNIRTKTAKRLGLDYDTLKKLNNRLIYLYLTGYGDKGPLAEKKGYDRLVQAVSGLYGKQRLADGTPMAQTVNIADLSTSMLLAYGALLALLAREKTGCGQKVETSLLKASVAMQSIELIRVQNEDPMDKSVNLRNTAMNVPYRCADGKYLLIFIVTEKDFVVLCRATDLEHLSSDTELVGWWNKARSSAELYEIFSAIFATKTRDEWTKILWKYDVSCMPILENPELFDLPQMVDNNVFISMNHPVGGRIEMMGNSLSLSDCKTRKPTLAPRIGEHTKEVLLECGYSEQQIDDLQNRKVAKQS